MKKHQIDEILFSLKQGIKPVFQFKASKTGLVQRTGVGTLPGCELTVSAAVHPTAVFEEILEAIPEHLPATNLFGEENSDSEVLEYVLSFHGGKHNEEQWELSSGIRILVDDSSNYTHPLLPLVDMIGNRCERSTARIYFDAMICYAFGAKASSLPESTLFTGPKAYTEKQKLFADYIQALHSKGQFSNMLLYGKSQTYSDSNLIEYKLESLNKEGTVSMQLIPSGIKGFRTAESNSTKAARFTPKTPATAGASEGMVLQIIGILTSMKVVFFILMLACIVYLTFYL